MDLLIASICMVYVFLMNGYDSSCLFNGDRKIMIINRQPNNAQNDKIAELERNTGLMLPIFQRTLGGHSITPLSSDAFLIQNNAGFSPLSPGFPEVSEKLKKRLNDCLPSIHPIKNEHSLQQISGIPFGFIPRFSRLLSTEQRAIAIAIRKVEIPALKYLQSGYPTKNFHIKGKSSNWGPHQGLIPVRQQYSKLAGTKAAEDKILAYDRDVKQCIARGFAVPVPFTMTETEIKALKNTKVVNGNIEWREILCKQKYDISARHIDGASEFTVFINDQLLDVLAYPKSWKCLISQEQGEKLQSWMSEHSFILYHESAYGKSYLINRDEGGYLINIINNHEGYTIDKDCIRLMKLLTDKVSTDEDLSFTIDNVTITPTPCMSTLPITADLDLFGVYSDASSDRREPLYPQRQLPFSPNNITPTTRDMIGKTECINAGNITREICDIIHTINSGVGNEVIHHSAEANNPFSGEMADNLPVVFIFSDAFKMKMAETIPDFAILFDRETAAVSVDNVNAVSALTSVFSEANMFGAWRSAWNKETSFAKTPVNGHAI
jgi:hypothetical protein